ncbi:MAG: L,D-transpeptidase/peptidoglycan binding protein [Bifidobacteriaceae bacterium]|nr:L,D-transpeptidase/peptidoglycan binding protein [Bifidobacteriaceae bacterium]
MPVDLGDDQLPDDAPAPPDEPEAAPDIPAEGEAEAGPEEAAGTAQSEDNVKTKAPTETKSKARKARPRKWRTKPEAQAEAGSDTEITSRPEAGQQIESKTEPDGAGEAEPLGSAAPTDAEPPTAAEPAATDAAADSTPPDGASGAALGAPLGAFESPVEEAETSAEEVETSAEEAQTPAEQAETQVGEAQIPAAEAEGAGAKPRRRHRTLKWSLAAVFVLAVAATGGVVYANHYYSDKAVPGVTLAGLPVAGQTAAELERTAANLVGGMRFTFTAAGDTLTGNAEELGVHADPKAIAGEVLAAAKGQPLWRKLNPWTDKALPVKAQVDQEALRQFLDAGFIAEDQATTDAAVAYDPETASFAVVPSFTGLRTEVEPAVEAIQAHLADTAAPAKVEVKTVPDPPAIDDAAAQAAVDAATAGLGRVITFDNGQSGVKARSYQLPAASIGAWTTFTADPAQGVIEVGYDADKVATELPGLLAEQVAIPSRKHVVMTYPDSDREIGVVQWGLNGLRMADPAPVIQEVAAALAEGRDAAVTVPLETDPFETERVKPPTNYDEPNGAHWIDVNKSTFIATLYAGSTPVGSYVISTGKPGHDTPSGTFYVYLKYEHQVMRGPASDPYESPTDWVSYFSGGVAFHSAPWNEPNNWQRRVSHGCVNMKTRDAKVVYDFAPIGTKVVVHG